MRKISLSIELLHALNPFGHGRRRITGRAVPADPRSGVELLDIWHDLDSNSLGLFIGPKLLYDEG
jgi:hypothetical protein